MSQNAVRKDRGMSRLVRIVARMEDGRERQIVKQEGEWFVSDVHGHAFRFLAKRFDSVRSWAKAYGYGLRKVVSQ